MGWRGRNPALGSPALRERDTRDTPVETVISGLADPVAIPAPPPIFFRSAPHQNSSLPPVEQNEGQYFCGQCSFTAQAQATGLVKVPGNRRVAGGPTKALCWPNHRMASRSEWPERTTAHDEIRPAISIGRYPARYRRGRRFPCTLSVLKGLRISPGGSMHRRCLLRRP